jgi:hypothetical protein
MMEFFDAEGKSLGMASEFCHDIENLQDTIIPALTPMFVYVLDTSVLGRRPQINDISERRLPIIAWRDKAFGIYPVIPGHASTEREQVFLETPDGIWDCDCSISFATIDEAKNVFLKQACWEWGLIQDGLNNKVSIMLLKSHFSKTG